MRPAVNDARYVVTRAHAENPKHPYDLTTAPVEELAETLKRRAQRSRKQFRRRPKRGSPTEGDV
jgi:hypothetical protein